MSLLSVIIPAYNREEYIERAIRSVQSQNYSDIEIIVVDDGSTDNTPAIIEKLAGLDARIRLVKHEKSKGAQAARNTGIRSAKGEWVAFLDSDDEWLPESLSKRLKKAGEQAVDVVYSSCLSVKYPDDEQRPFFVPALNGMVYREMLSRPGPMFQSLLVRMSALEKIGFLDESIISYQEWDTSIRLARYFPFGFVSEPTFIYYRHESETISKNILKEALGYEQVFKKYYDDMKQFLTRKEMALHYRLIAKFYDRAGKLDEARKYLILSVGQWPFGRIFLHIALHIWRTIQAFFLKKHIYGK